MCVILAVLAALLIYATKIEPYRLKVKQVDLAAGLLKEVKIVQISDIQISKNYTTKHLKRVVEKMNQQQPDIVLFTGDLHENYAEYHSDEELIDTLGDIKATYGKFAIWGNRDYGGGAARQYPYIMQQSGFELLQNQGVSIQLNSRESLFLAGVDDALLGNPDIAPIESALKKADCTYALLMTHEPDTADQYADTGFNLIVAGHSHGGQVNIPLLPQITTAMAEKYVAGLYQLNQNTSLYVNVGIGTSRYPLRFGVVPEITVFCLTTNK